MIYIALTIFITARSDYCAICFKPDCMSTTSRNRHNIAPTTHSALTVFIPANGDYCAICFKPDAMAASRCYRRNIVPIVHSALARASSKSL
jgi:hypothetical protein